MKNGIYKDQTRILFYSVDDNVGRTRYRPLERARCPPDMTHTRELPKPFGTAQNPVNHGIRRTRHIFCNSCIRSRSSYAASRIITLIGADVQSALAPLQA